MTAAQKSPFVKQLAANDRPTRDKAVESLKTYLSGRRAFTDVELQKLWKGLFFCMWMSDRPRTQQRLASDLADLVGICHESNKVAFLRAFWTTMGREWTNIDVLRMDKFLLLVRRYLGATFSYLETTKWDKDLTKSHMAVLNEVPLSPRNSKISNGLRYHILDIYVDELDKADHREHSPTPLDLLMGPVEKLKLNSPVKVVRKRAADILADERLQDWENKKQPAEDNGSEGSETEPKD